ncbi:MAG: sulfite exporter TauE/SafE family protein [Alphaproteobacteria bacterium]|nr:sulfite exporter TauE/SafE family protein [Alphaproteobacteria bacterium]
MPDFLPEILAIESLWLIIGGCLIGIFATVIGGSMFLSIPFLQWLFPGLSFGTLVGNLKVKGFFRSIGSTITTHKKIDYIGNFKIAGLAFIGTILGASVIAHLDQKWLFPAIIFAVLLTLLAPKLSSYISNKTFIISAFLTGAYAGFFGAGIGILLIALVRLKHPKDTEIAYVKIQARFVELLLVVTAVGTHFFHGNLVTSIWLPLSAGAFLGGLIGGVLLDKMGHLSASKQKAVLYTALAFATLASGLKFFNIL